MSELSYLADMHISPVTCQLLRQAGYQVKRITDVMPANSKDAEIILYALKKQMVIVTQDLDFSALLIASCAPGPSVLSLRLSTIESIEVAELLLEILPQLETDLKTGAIITVTERRIRIRHLPITMPE